MLNVILIILLAADLAMHFFVAYGKRKPKEYKPEPKKQGEITFVMKNVENPVIVDVFARKFSDAVVETGHCEEFFNEEIKADFTFDHVKMNPHLVEEINRAGFRVTNNP